MSASAVLLHASTAEEGASSDQPGLRVGRADFDQPIQVAQRCSGPMVPLLQHGPHEQHFRRRRLEVPPWRENALGAAHVARIARGTAQLDVRLRQARRFRRRTIDVRLDPLQRPRSSRPIGDALEHLVVGARDARFRQHGESAGEDEREDELCVARIHVVHAYAPRRGSDSWRMHSGRRDRTPGTKSGRRNRSTTVIDIVTEIPRGVIRRSLHRCLPPP